MNLLSMLFVLFFVYPLPLISLTDESNILIYGDTVQVNSTINEYENVVANVPITGTIMVTHPSNLIVDVHSFTMGENLLKVALVKSTIISSFNNLEVTIFQFQLEGMPSGPYTLSPIKVKVGEHWYQGAPITINVQ